MYAALRLEEWPAAVDAFLELAEADPDWLAELELSDVMRVARAARETSAKAQHKLFQTLDAHGYTSPDPLRRDDFLRIERARLLLSEGETTAAVDALRPVAYVRAILELRADKTFDPVRVRLASDAWDVAAAAERELERARADVLAHPRRLMARVNVVDALRALGRSEEAIAAADAALAEYEEAPDDFSDVEESLNWLRNERAYALYDLGRFADGRGAMARAIGDGENGHANVSQVINSAILMSDEGLAARALARITSMQTEASPYGDMWAASVFVCAHEQLGNQARVRERLDFMRAHESDNPSALARALLCVGGIEEAAALYVRRLQDPALRGAALKALQIYELGDVVLPGRAQLYARLGEVRDHPDVRAAVAAVGRIEALPLHRTYWGAL
jgi:tetratricopeptide (TPR) repeat protein